MMRTRTMLAGTMRNHIEITAGKSTRPRRTRSSPDKVLARHLGAYLRRTMNVLLYRNHEFESIAA